MPRKFNSQDAKPDPDPVSLKTGVEEPRMEKDLCAMGRPIGPHLSSERSTGFNIFLIRVIREIRGSKCFFLGSGAFPPATSTHDRRQ